MVTKGYRKGVYDRVTEGTWETTQAGTDTQTLAAQSLAHALGPNFSANRPQKS